MKKFLILSLLLFFMHQTYSQHIVMTYQDAAKKGIFEHLDSLYKSAVHTDTAKAAFKSQQEEQRFQNAYGSLFDDIGDYLFENNYKWITKVKCASRVYFKEDGTIDYFIYKFLPIAGNPDPFPVSQREKFETLMSQFIKEHQLALSAPVKFEHRSLITYLDPKR